MKPKTIAYERSPAKPRLRSALFTLLALVAITAKVSPVCAAQGISGTLRPLTGQPFSGTINAIAEDGTVTGQGIPAGMNLADLKNVLIETAGSKNLNSKNLNSSDWIKSHPVKIVPVGGGQFWVANPQVNRDSLTFESEFAEGTLPLQTIRAIVWTDSPGVERAIAEPSTEDDQIIVAVADGERTVSGILEAIDREFVTVNYQGESRQIGLSKVKAIVSADIGLKQPEGSLTTITLAGGSVVSGQQPTLADDVFRLKILGRGTLQMEARRILKLSVQSDRLQYLSDLEPMEVEESSVFAVQLSWRRDQSVGGNPLSIRGDDQNSTPLTFEKGLGTQSLSRLVFANERGFDRFQATVGIDTETRGRGDCQVVVRGDGIELWSQRVRAADPPYRLDLDIQDMKEVTLQVYPGEEFDLADHLNWADAKFLKTK